MGFLKKLSPVPEILVDLRIYQGYYLPFVTQIADLLKPRIVGVDKEEQFFQKVTCPLLCESVLLTMVEVVFTSLQLVQIEQSETIQCKSVKLPLKEKF